MPDGGIFRVRGIYDSGEKQGVLAAIAIRAGEISIRRSGDIANYITRKMESESAAQKFGETNRSIRVCGWGIRNVEIAGMHLARVEYVGWISDVGISQRQGRANGDVLTAGGQSILRSGLGNLMRMAGTARLDESYGASEAAQTSNAIEEAYRNESDGAEKRPRRQTRLQEKRSLHIHRVLRIPSANKKSKC